MSTAAEILSALALEGRLAIFRHLVRAGPAGVRAGEIGGAVGAHPSTLSANLTVLSHAGLVDSRRDGRSIIYTARYDQMRELLAFLLDDCCNGSAEVCQPLMDIATRTICCASDQVEFEELAT